MLHVSNFLSYATPPTPNNVMRSIMAGPMVTAPDENDRNPTSSTTKARVTSMEMKMNENYNRCTLLQSPLRDHISSYSSSCSVSKNISSASSNDGNEIGLALVEPTVTRQLIAVTRKLRTVTSQVIGVATRQMIAATRQVIAAANRQVNAATQQEIGRDKNNKHSPLPQTHRNISIQDHNPSSCLAK